MVLESYVGRWVLDSPILLKPVMQKVKVEKRKTLIGGIGSGGELDSIIHLL